MDTRLVQSAEESNIGRTIRITDNAGTIEETAGRRRFSLVMRGKLHNYEKRMLCDNCCPHTLPMYFTEIEGTERAYYDFTGFLQLETYIGRNENEMKGRDNHKRIGEALELFSMVLDCIKGMESYLLFPERFSICSNTIFVHSDGHVSIAFYGNGNPELSLQDRIIALIDDFQMFYKDSEAERYLNRYKEMILMKNPGLDGMISILGTLRREVSYIYWNSKNLRKEENKISMEYDGIEQDQNAKGRGRLGFSLKKDGSYGKLFAVQAALAAGLVAVYMTGILEFTSFIGLTVLIAGSDLWLMRKLNLFTIL